MPIQIIDNWEVSIRPCEINRFADIFGAHTEIGSNNVEFRNLMQLLTHNRYSLVDLLTSSNSYYSWTKTYCASGAKVTHIFGLLDQARELIQTNAPGNNTIRYLLHKLNNRIMKSQYNDEACDGLSGLYLKWGCIPFDKMPYATSLVKHNPRIYDLFDCINPSGRDHEFLARAISNNTEQKGILFTPTKELERFENLEELQRKYNSNVYYKHRDRYLRVFKDHWYIEGFANDTAEIIKKLKDLSTSGIAGYTNFVNSWLAQNTSYRIERLAVYFPL